MFLNALLALLNGALIGLNRALNARMGITVGASGASLWNHLVGFVFLLLIVAVSGSGMPDLQMVPPIFFLGGVIGGSFVALSSFIYPKLGATRTTLLIVAGEMIAGCWIDAIRGNLQHFITALVGIVFILVGTSFSQPKQETAEQVEGP